MLDTTSVAVKAILMAVRMVDVMVDEKVAQWDFGSADAMAVMWVVKKVEM